MFKVDINPAFRKELLQQRKTIFGKKRYLFHIVIWLAALCYLTFNILSDDFSRGIKIGLNSGSTKPINEVFIKQSRFFLISFISSATGALMVYFYLLLVIPYARYKKQRRYLWIGLVINCAIWLMAFILAAMILGMTHTKLDTLKTNDSTLIFMMSAAFSGITAALFFSLYYFLDLYDQQKDLNQYRDLLTQKLEAETNFLKTQINPHFLFNTLNNIYSLTLSRSADAAHITRQLKDLITYMLQDCSKDQVLLSGEIEFLSNYIDLEKLRNKQEHANIQLNIHGIVADQKIAPLLLVNFVENAFKHGVKAGVENAFVNIELQIMNNMLTVEIVNSKPVSTNQPNKAVKEVGGIGIQNVKRRLNILYPQRHKLSITESKTEFSVYLSIDL